MREKILVLKEAGWLELVGWFGVDTVPVPVIPAPIAVLLRGTSYPFDEFLIYS